MNLPDTMYDYRYDRSMNVIDDDFEEQECSNCGFHYFHDGFPECPECGNIEQDEDF